MLFIMAAGMYVFMYSQHVMTFPSVLYMTLNYSWFQVSCAKIMLRWHGFTFSINYIVLHIQMP